MLNKLAKNLAERFLSEDDLLSVFNNKFDPVGSDIEQETKREIFTDMSKIDNIDLFLDATLSNDLDRYFGVDDDKGRFQVRGAYLRTSYIKSQIRKARKGWESESDGGGIASYIR